MRLTLALDISPLDMCLVCLWDYLLTTRL